MKGIRWVLWGAWALAIGGGVGVAWYHALSAEDQARFDQLAEKYARELYGLARDQLNGEQARRVNGIARRDFTA